MDAEMVHNVMLSIGENLEIAVPALERLFVYKNTMLKRSVLGIPFANPVGLAAGFDADGHCAGIMKHVGFGFNTVGTVTAKPSQGNPKPRYGRLPKSLSLFVNKGFRSDGADEVAKRLETKDLRGHMIGISVGSTNSQSVSTISKAIDDYLYTFHVFKDKPYVSYFELNISCPNIIMTESFEEKRHYQNLIREVAALRIRQPILVKMPNEIHCENIDILVRSGLAKEIQGYIFSNLVTDRSNDAFNSQEVQRFAGINGNFSGRPAKHNALHSVRHVRKTFGHNIAIVGAGGICTVSDAIEYFQAGADLIQLITGMIYQGPQITGELCKGITEYFSKTSSCEINKTLLQ